MQWLIAGLVLIVLGVVFDQNVLWLIGIGAVAGGALRMFYYSDRGGRKRRST